MLVVIGGAYAGKRTYVREKYARGKPLTWISAYDGQEVDRWSENWPRGHSLVIEGWEHWVRVCINEQKQLTQAKINQLRRGYLELIRELKDAEEKKHVGISDDPEVILIMLEVGKGVVPIDQYERYTRDVLGWLSQDAAATADEVVYIWHGLSQNIKSR